MANSTKEKRRKWYTSQGGKIVFSFVPPTINPGLSHALYLLQDWLDSVVPDDPSPSLAHVPNSKPASKKTCAEFPTFMRR